MVSACRPSPEAGAPMIWEFLLITLAGQTQYHGLDGLHWM